MSRLNLNCFGGGALQKMNIQHIYIIVEVNTSYGLTFTSSIHNLARLS